MEKIYRILGVTLLILLLTAACLLTIDNISTRRQLAELRSDYSKLADRNRLLEGRIEYYAGLSQFISNEVEQLDIEFRRASSNAGSGISGLQAQVDALRSWAEGHRSLEQAIIQRLNEGANQ